MKNTLTKHLIIISCLAVAPLNIPNEISDIVNQYQTPSPKITISSPADGEVYRASGNLNLEFLVENFTFVDFKSNTEPFPGNRNAGHARLWIDPPVVPKLENSRKILSTSEISLDDLSVGRHKIIMELVQNNFESYNPAVREEVSFYIVTPRKWGIWSVILAILVVAVIMAGAAYLFYKFLWKREDK
jgi:hypothetical protein